MTEPEHQPKDWLSRFLIGFTEDYFKRAYTWDGLLVSICIGIAFLAVAILLR